MRFSRRSLAQPALAKALGPGNGWCSRVVPPTAADGTLHPGHGTMTCHALRCLCRVVSYMIQAWCLAPTIEGSSQAYDDGPGTYPAVPTPAAGPGCRRSRLSPAGPIVVTFSQDAITLVPPSKVRAHRGAGRTSRMPPPPTRAPVSPISSPVHNTYHHHAHTTLPFPRAPPLHTLQAFASDRSFKPLPLRCAARPLTCLLTTDPTRLARATLRPNPRAPRSRGAGRPSFVSVDRVRHDLLATCTPTGCAVTGAHLPPGIVCGSRLVCVPRPRSQPPAGHLEPVKVTPQFLFTRRDWCIGTGV